LNLLIKFSLFLSYTLIILFNKDACPILLNRIITSYFLIFSSVLAN